ncbi:MAG: diphthine synthase [Nanoarchaeota archaeon]|nr:diphthine synthase [Nanoarchaeota archaeon]
MLNIIGIGLNDEKDVSVKGLELIHSSDFIYLENYTSKLKCSLEDLEKFYAKKVILVEREFVEDGKEMIEKAKTQNVSLLIIGDVFSATTHISLYQDALDSKLEINIINNASVLNAIGITGLSLYKFGKTTSISFHDSEVPIKVIKDNRPLHTLCLLDLTPKEDRFMEASEAIARLISQGLDPETKVVVCSQLGSKNPTIIYSQAKDVKPLNKYPQCLIVPGDLHFIEEEFLENFK